MMIKRNIFYVTSEKTVYICWEKIPGLTGYEIYRDGNLLADSENNEFVRPYELERNHRTELFKPATRNWLYFKDSTVQDLQRYSYQIKGVGETTAETYESLITEVYTE